MRATSAVRQPLRSEVVTWGNVARPAPVRAGRFRSDKWEKTAVFLVLGYVLFNRTFAYLGIPPLKLFIGEMVLFSFLICRQREGLDTWARALAQSGPAHDCAWSILLFIAYGIFETCRGVALGYSLTTCLENLAFNYYALYLLFGWWVGQRNPGLLRTLAVKLAWCNGISGARRRYLQTLQTKAIRSATGILRESSYADVNSEIAFALRQLILSPVASPTRHREALVSFITNHGS
jgi:hypothetical protein